MCRQPDSKFSDIIIPDQIAEAVSNDELLANTLDRNCQTLASGPHPTASGSRSNSD